MQKGKRAIQKVEGAIRLGQTGRGKTGQVELLVERGC